MQDRIVIFDIFEKVLINVLNLNIAKKNKTKEPACIDEEQTVAALEFFGDYSGYILMVLCKKDQDKISADIMKRFSIDIPLENSQIFAEVLNIYAGNLITEFLFCSKNINIYSPEKSFEHFSSLKSTHAFKYWTDTGDYYKFSLYFRR